MTFSIRKLIKHKLTKFNIEKAKTVKLDIENKMTSKTRFFHSENFFCQKLLMEFKVVHKHTFITEFCRDKKVLHIGCCDWPIMNIQNNLHYQLSLITKELVGVDTALEELNKMKEFYKKLRFESDLDSFQNVKFDIVLGPDVLEHVDNVKDFLIKIKNINSKLLLFSVPNAFSLATDKKISQNIEEVHFDHRCYFSPYTLYNTLTINGFNVIGLLGYDTPLNVWKSQFVKRYRLRSHGVIAICGGEHKHN